MAEYESAGVYYVRIEDGRAYVTTPYQEISNTLTDFDEASSTFEAGEQLGYVGEPFGVGYREEFVGYTPNGVVTSNGGLYFLETSDPDLQLEDSFPLTAGDFVVCFWEGVRIATPDGPAAVETLAVGDLVLTADGAPKPIRWLGRQTIVRQFADPDRVAPIRFLAGALGDGLPCADLLVSPDHALFLDGGLVQAGALVNGLNVLRETRLPERFVYFHIELDDHALVLAEGVAAETFIDNVSRRRFDNGAEVVERQIAEMDLPRIKSARQAPPALRTWIAQRAKDQAAASAA